MQHRFIIFHLVGCRADVISSHLHGLHIPYSVEQVEPRPAIRAIKFIIVYNSVAMEVTKESKLYSGQTLVCTVYTTHWKYRLWIRATRRDISHRALQLRGLRLRIHRFLRRPRARPNSSCEALRTGLTEGRDRYSPVDTPDERYMKTVQVIGILFGFSSLNEEMNFVALRGVPGLLLCSWDFAYSLKSPQRTKEQGILHDVYTISDSSSLRPLPLSLSSSSPPPPPPLFSYTISPYNFYMFPASTNYKLDQRFMCQSSSLAFLATHNMDFNKWIKGGEVM